MAYSSPFSYPRPGTFRTVKDSEDYCKQLLAALNERDARADYVKDKSTDADLKDLIYRPEWYGAKGDGVTDDTTALQAAIDAAEAKYGGMVFLGQKKYRITTALTIDESITIQGVGKGKQFVTMGSSLTSTIYLDHSDPSCAIWIKPGVEGVTLRGFNLTGNEATAGATTGHGILIDGSTDNSEGHLIESVRVADFKESGIVIRDNAFMINLVDVYVYSCGSKGIVTEEPNGGVPGQVRLFGCVLDNNTTADFYNSSNSASVWCYGCTFSGASTDGIYNIEGQFHVNGCHFEDVDHGIYNYGSGTIGVLYVNDCLFSGCATNSILLYDAARTFIGKNRYTGSPTGGHVASNVSWGSNNYIFDPDSTTGTRTSFASCINSPRESVYGLRAGTTAIRTGASDHTANEVYYDTTTNRWWWYSGSAWTEIKDQDLKQTDSPSFNHVHVMGSSEVVTDGGLEAWTSSTNLTNWTEGILGTSTVTQDAADFHGGANSARLDIDASNSTAYIRQNITMTAGGQYTVSAWYKTEAGKNALLNINNQGLDVGLNSSGTWAAVWVGIQLAASTSWKEYTLPFVAHASYSTYMIDLRNDTGASSSAIRFDDISVSGGTDTFGNGNVTIGGSQVVGSRVVDARASAVANSGDATTDGLIDALRDAMISHGLIAAS
jgi:hypothetical protein